MPVRCLPVTRRPARVASPGSSRVVDLPALFHAGSSMGTHPSEVSPRSRRTILSDPAVPLAVCLAERPPERALDAICRAKASRTRLSARAHLAVSRLRGFELPAHLAPCGVRPRCERMRSPPSALFTPPMSRSSPGCSSPSRMTSRPRPTLLQGSSHGLQSCTRALGPPCGELRAQMYVRSSEFQRTGRTDPILIARQAELP